MEGEEGGLRLELSNDGSTGTSGSLTAAEGSVAGGLAAALAGGGGSGGGSFSGGGGGGGVGVRERSGTDMGGNMSPPKKHKSQGALRCTVQRAVQPRTSGPCVRTMARAYVPAHGSSRQQAACPYGAMLHQRRVCTTAPRLTPHHPVSHHITPHHMHNAHQTRPRHTCYLQHRYDQQCVINNAYD